MPHPNPGLRVGVVGATGMVGRELLLVLEKRRFPVRELLVFSSGSGRKTVSFRGKLLRATGIGAGALDSCDLVFFVSSDDVSKKHAPGLAARGVFVIDDSSAFRLDPKVPLVIPEVNAQVLSPLRRLIAGPNCTMTGLAVAAFPLHRRAGVKELRLASYQSVSGAGRAALEEFFSQSRLLKGLALSSGRAPILSTPKASALPRPMAFNVFPQVGGFDRDGRSSEELKVAAELRKVWEAPDLKVSVTAVRVPAIRGHCLAAWLTLRRPLTPARAREMIARAPGVRLSAPGDYPTPRSCAGRWPVYAGRLRQGTGPSELCLWIASDNLLKGAALNSVQIAEELLRRGWLNGR